MLQTIPVHYHCVLKKLLCQILGHILTPSSLKFLSFKRKGGGDQHIKVVVKANLRNRSIVQFFLSKIPSEFARLSCPADPGCFTAKQHLLFIFVTTNLCSSFKQSLASFWVGGVASLLFTRYHDHSNLKRQDAAIDMFCSYDFIK